MPVSPDAFASQALAARAKIVAALDEIHGILAECDEDEVSHWSAQARELRQALAMIDEQLQPLRSESAQKDVSH